MTDTRLLQKSLQQCGGLCRPQHGITHQLRLHHQPHQTHCRDCAEQNPLGSLLLPILHSPGVMLVCRRRQRQPHIEIRQISDGAQGSSSSNKPALLKVMPCCCNGAWRVGKSLADRRPREAAGSGASSPCSTKSRSNCFRLTCFSAALAFKRANNGSGNSSVVRTKRPSICAY